MASTINAITTGTGGIVATGDTSGVVAIQGNGTTGLTVGGGYINLPTWTNATRPGTPTTGTFGYNSTNGQIETYNGSAWVISSTAPTYTASYLLVAGGGAGGQGNTNGGSGGGGAGGYITGTTSLAIGTTYTFTVGGGGASSNASGSNSTGFSLTALGGGGGGVYSAGPANGSSGGSGGGAAENGTGGAGTPGQGFSGGSGISNSAGGGGGGGGGAAPNITNPGTPTAGVGGVGVSSSITGGRVVRPGAAHRAGRGRTAHGPRRLHALLLAVRARAHRILRLCDGGGELPRARLYIP